MSDTCIDPRDGRELELAFYAGGDLEPEAAARVDEHLDACSACRSFVHGLRVSQAGLAALAAEPLDPEALARVRHAVRRRIEAEARRTSAVPPWLLPLAAGLIVALAGAALWWLTTAPGPPHRPERPPETVASAPPVAPPIAPAVPSFEAPAATSAEETGGVPPPAATPPIGRASAPPRPEPRPEHPAVPREPAVHNPIEPMVIQVVSDDPDIVFYWLVEPKETDNESVSS